MFVTGNNVLNVQYFITIPKNYSHKTYEDDVSINKKKEQEQESKTKTTITTTTTEDPTLIL